MFERGNFPPYDDNYPLDGDGNPIDPRLFEEYGNPYYDGNEDDYYQPAVYYPEPAEYESPNVDLSRSNKPHRLKSSGWIIAVAGGLFGVAGLIGYFSKPESVNANDINQAVGNLNNNNPAYIEPSPTPVYVPPSNNPNSPETPTPIPIPPEMLNRNPRIAPLFYRYPIAPYANTIVQVADNYGFDPNIYATIGLIESCFNPNAHRYDNYGAKGLWQIDPNSWSDEFTNYYDVYEAGVFITDKIIKPIMDQYVGDPLQLEYMLANYNKGDRGLAVYQGRTPRKPLTQVQKDEMYKYIRLGRGIYNEALAGLTFSQTAFDNGHENPGSMCAKSAREAGYPVWPFPEYWLAAIK